MFPPILLLIYNRPEHTRQVVLRLWELGIRELYVSADGPKDAQDRVACELSRNSCTVDGMTIIPHFSAEHLGCKTGVIRGIDWFFSQVEEGMILENDCLPNAAFFHFSSQLLERHRDTPSIYMVSGSTPMGRWDSGHSHHFARIGHVWGWATWRDRWKDFDPELSALNSFIEDNGFTRLFGYTAIPVQLERNVRKALDGKTDTWDFQWTLHHAMQGRLAAIPSENMVENIGFGIDATHTDERPEWVSDHVGTTLIELTVPPVLPDRDYEMSLHISQRRNEAVLPSAHSFQMKGHVAMRLLRILQINSTDGGGGAESLVMSHHQALLTKGHAATVLVAENQSGDEGVMVMKADIAGQIESLRPDIVHAHNLHGTPLSLKVLTDISKRIPVLWTLHDAWVTTGSLRHPFQLDGDELSFLDREEWNRELKYRGEELLRSNIRFTAPSQWMRSRLLESHGLPSYFADELGIDAMTDTFIGHYMDMMHG